MRTEKQAEASRLNGAKSRGPRTAEGKARSSRNALRSGLYSENTVSDFEPAHEFERLQEEYTELYTPYDAEERMCLDMLIRAEIEWRRLVKVETRIWDIELTKDMRSSTHRWGEAFINGQLSFIRVHRFMQNARRDYYEALSRLKKFKAAREAEDAESDAAPDLEPIETTGASEPLGFVPSLPPQPSSQPLAPKPQPPACAQPLGFVPSLSPQPSPSPTPEPQLPTPKPQLQAPTVPRAIREIGIRNRPGGLSSRQEIQSWNKQQISLS